MNKTYALVWNQTQGCWSAVGETARRRAKPGSAKRVAAALSLLGFTALPAFALPTGENITTGKADIIRDNDGKSMSINQHTDKLITNWNDFSIAANERVAFHQPGKQSIALNRVVGNNGSQIQGQLDANGKVFLVNPNGVLFGSGAQINVGGLVASTQNIADADFLAGNYRFSGNSTASIVNDGHITAADGGSVALLGARVSNNGVIQAKMGRVALGAGNAFKVNFDGNDLLSLQVEGGAVDAQATNGGLLKADGGEVLMTARAASNLLNAVVNNTGTIEAKGLASHAGKITLDGGTVLVGGTLDASAAEAGAPAGSIVTRGEQVSVARGATVDTRAGDTAGTWTIEAANAGVAHNNADSLYPDGASIDADTLSHNLGTTNVALTNTRGDLTVGGPVAWNSDRSLTLTSQKGNVDLKQTLSSTGANASLNVNAADKIRIDDTVKLTGRNAHLELNAKNGHTLNDKAVVTLSGDNASFRSNGEDYKVLHTVADLRGIDANLGGRYVIGNTIDGANASFRSIGGDRAFHGVFDGLGNTISRLSITNTGPNVGLFGQSSGTLANLTLDSLVVDGTSAARAAFVGGLVGDNLGGRITNVTAKNMSVSYNGREAVQMGGLVGRNLGSIDRARFAGRVSGSTNAFIVGGLVGSNVGTIADSEAFADVTLSGRPGMPLDSHFNPDVQSAGGLVGMNGGRIVRSSSGGHVSGRDNTSTGGFVGVNYGTIRDASTSATVTAGKGGYAGGFVGKNRDGGTIANASASGSVTAAGAIAIGGFVGENARGTLDDVRSTGDVTDLASGHVGGLAGSNRGTIRNAHATATVKAGRNSHAGGLVGTNDGTVSNASAEGKVSAGEASDVGGLVGLNTGVLDTVQAAVDVTAGNGGRVGGLVGANRGNKAIVRHASASGTAAADGSSVGGLVGLNDKGALIEASSSTGTIAGNRSHLGGLVGENAGTIRASTSSSRLNLVSPDYGGFFWGRLVGLNTESGNIETNSVSGSAQPYSTVGMSFGKIDGQWRYGSVSW
ncbi:filamentous hemagglutinin N-terminal domain-containing protein [Burkholderia sp. Bp9143]|uniref:two-partner secretion domain-containing protein n=1 Tax=Burkholderia sp. Bp9143 TaxID=2184574 RepID=UPI000F5AECED|nr:GLUG motif-containing protein [Burkholderia sp. Bp9143]RQR33114.1 filamentous hemagglutinin N-terminal domain-containing protein [Burkholderia sp. Bp9143]